MMLFYAHHGEKLMQQRKLDKDTSYELLNRKCLLHAKYNYADLKCLLLR